MPRKKKKLTIQQLLIEKFLKSPESIWRDGRKRGEQLKLATDLSKLYDRDFWEKLYLPFKLNTLAWFKTADGKEFIFIEYKKLFLNLDGPENIKLGKKVGRDKKAKKTKKPSTVLEFLNEKKEK